MGVAGGKSQMEQLSQDKVLRDVYKIYRFRWGLTIEYLYAPVAESVDALDLKSNRGSPSVPVQVWPGANLKRLTKR